MAKNILTANIEIQNSDKVQTLIGLLDMYQDDIPDKLKESLLELADCDACVIGHEKAAEMAGTNNFDALVDGEARRGVVSFNPILKRLNVHSSFYDGTDRPENDENGLVISHLYPKAFELSKDGKVFYSWAK